MSSEDNKNKDIANSLGKYSDYKNKGINIGLDTVSQLNKWYEQVLDKITNNEEISTRLVTKVDNYNEETVKEDKNTENLTQTESSKIQTQVETKADDNGQQTKSRVNTKANINDLSDNDNVTDDETADTTIDMQENENTSEVINDKKVSLNKSSKAPKRIATLIKGAKMINNTTNKVIKTGKLVSLGMNEETSKGFEKSASRIMTKPIEKVASKVSHKITNKATNILVKHGIKVVKGTTRFLIKVIQLLAKLISAVMKMIIGMLPKIAPVMIILIIIVSFCSFFGIGMSDETRNSYEDYMIQTQNEYDAITVNFYNEGKIVEGAIDGKGMINWKAPLSIIQMLNGDMKYDEYEQELLQKFKNAGLFETIKDVIYTYEKEIEETDENGNKTTRKETVTETKKIVNNPFLEDYISWCNNNFSVINNYKKNKKIDYDETQKTFTDDEIEQIKLLYNSTSFFELFSQSFKDTYAYSYVEIGDEQLQAIYNEFLANVGIRYLMDHSNLKYDECMSYYDCSSWVIHCLAHTGIKTIANTSAEGIYKNYCNPISVNDRKGGDLIFLKDTYDTGSPGSISHIGIYMGELTINGETAEWVIDTGGNPSGVRIRKYNNGWWNGSHFYGFGRLK